VKNDNGKTHAFTLLLILESASQREWRGASRLLRGGGAGVPLCAVGVWCGGSVPLSHGVPSDEGVVEASRFRVVCRRRPRRAPSLFSRL